MRLVRRGRDYVRVSTIGADGERGFLLIPGIGVSSDYFERLAPHLNEFGPVHALDLPGFGGVPHPGRAMTIAEYAELVNLVIDELGLPDPIVVGHSMGSQVATEVAVSRPDLSTLVLIGPVVDADTRNPWQQAFAFLRSAAREPMRVKVLAVSSYLLCGWRWFFRVLPQMLYFPLEERVVHVQASTLVLRGEHDHVCPLPWVRRLLDDLPNGRAWEISGAAHSVMYAHAAAVAQLCVGHARHPDGVLDAAEMRRLQQAGDEADRIEASMRRERRSLRKAWAVLTARAIEWRGLLRQDEAAVAEGKEKRGEIEIHDRTTDRSDLPEGADGVVEGTAGRRDAPARSARDQLGTDT